MTKYDLLASRPADLGGIIDTVRAKAMAGDMQAARIILDRLVPSLRPVEIPTAVSIPAGATLAGQAQAVIEAAANGSLAAGQAARHWRLEKTDFMSPLEVRQAYTEKMAA